LHWDSLAVNKKAKILVWLLAGATAIVLWQFVFSQRLLQEDKKGNIIIKSTIDRGNIAFDIQNKKKLAICIEPNDFDSLFVRIPLYQDGKEVPHIGLAEPFRSKNSATNYAVPYYIVMPNAILDQYYALSNFKLKKGPFQVKILLPYYHCSDLIDVKGSQAIKEPKVYLMKHTATFEIK
jgi:hypothetical protein